MMGEKSFAIYTVNGIYIKVGQKGKNVGVTVTRQRWVEI